MDTVKYAGSTSRKTGTAAEVQRPSLRLKKGSIHRPYIAGSPLASQDPSVSWPISRKWPDREKLFGCWQRAEPKANDMDGLIMDGLDTEGEGTCAMISTLFLCITSTAVEGGVSVVI